MALLLMIEDYISNLGEGEQKMLERIRLMNFVYYIRKV